MRIFRLPSLRLAEVHRMELYLFVWNMLAWSITAALCQPLMIVWLRYAYNVWHGRKPIEEELEEELWPRSWRASLWTSFAVIALLLLDYATIDWLDLPAGPVHVVYLISLLAASGGLMYYFFFMEDFFQGLSLAVIYLYIPVAVLFVLWLVALRFIPIGLLSFVQSWLKNPELP